MLSKRYESTEVERRTWLQVPSWTLWSTLLKQPYQTLHVVQIHDLPTSKPLIESSKISETPTSHRILSKTIHKTNIPGIAISRDPNSMYSSKHVPARDRIGTTCLKNELNQNQQNESDENCSSVSLCAS